MSSIVADTETLMSRYIDFVYAAACRQTRDAAMAEEVTQAVFLVMARKKRSGGLPEEKHMFGWLLQTTRFTVKAARRTAVRRGYHEKQAGVKREQAANSKEQVQGAEVRAVLDEALLELGQVDREVIVRRYLHDEPLREVGAAVGMSENSAGRRVARAVEKLREILRRRGVASPAEVLVGAMGAEAFVKTPPGVATTVGHLGASTGASALAKAVLRRSVMAKVFSVAGVAVLAAIVGGALLNSAQSRVQAATGASTAPAAAAVESTSSAPLSLDAAWADLEELEPSASRGLLRLAEDPAESVSFFKMRLPPLKIEAADVRLLLTDLGSVDEATWHGAYEKLAYFDPRLAIDLPTLMNEVTEQPARNRLVALLSDNSLSEMTGEPYEGKEVKLRKSHGTSDDYNFVAENRSWWAESEVGRLTSKYSVMKRKWSQADHAILILKQIGTPDSLEILQNMATGHPNAEPTQLAKAALDRIAAAATQPAEIQDLEAWWNDLEKSPPVAFPSLLKMARAGEKAVPFLKERLHPLTITAEEVQTLVGALGSDDEKEWKPAFKKLCYYDPRLAVPLYEIFRSTFDPTARERLVEVLSDVPEGTYKGKEVQLSKTDKNYYNFYIENAGSWGAQPSVAMLNTRNGWDSKKLWTQAERAEILLGRIGTAEAAGILREMATGNGEALPTKVAVEELRGIQNK